jgi:predicted enzyme related to lactoylglutathione lyase
MLETSSIRAVLFAKDLIRMVAFYSEALGLSRGEVDAHHAVLQRNGFDLIVHQIPVHMADRMEIADPPVRRETGAVRLDYPVENVRTSRSKAKFFGGDIDEAPPSWAERDSNFFLGYDPEGNVFGVSQQAR